MSKVKNSFENASMHGGSIWPNYKNPFREMHKRDNTTVTPIQKVAEGVVAPLFYTIERGLDAINPSKVKDKFRDDIEEISNVRNYNNSQAMMRQALQDSFDKKVEKTVVIKQVKNNSLTKDRRLRLQNELRMKSKPNDDSLVESNPGPKAIFPSKKGFKKAIKKEKKKIKKEISGAIFPSKKGFKKAKKEMKKMGVSYQKAPTTTKLSFNFDGNGKGKKRRKNVSILSGCDLMTRFVTNESSIVIDKADELGKLYFTALLNPTGLDIQRLGSIAQFFSMYRFRHARFFMKPGLGSNQSGAVEGFWDPDINDEPSIIVGNGLENLIDASAHMGAKTLGLNRDELSWTMPKFGSKWYFVNQVSSDARFVQQARFNLELANSVKTVDDNTNAGNVWFEWEIELKDPQTHLPPSVTPTSPAVSIITQTVANGGTIATDASFFPVTSSIDTYSRQLSPGVALTRISGGDPYYGVLLLSGNCYYITVDQTVASGGAVPVITIKNVVTNAAAGPQTITSFFSTTKTSVQIVMDLTGVSNSNFGMFIQHKSTGNANVNNVIVSSDSRPFNSANIMENKTFRNPEMARMHNEIQKLKPKIWTPLLDCDNKEGYTHVPWTPDVNKFDKKFSSVLRSGKRQMPIDQKTGDEIPYNSMMPGANHRDHGMWFNNSWQSVRGRREEKRNKEQNDEPDYDFIRHLVSPFKEITQEECDDRLEQLARADFYERKEKSKGKSEEKKDKVKT